MGAQYMSTREEFLEWKKNWYEKIPKCKDFVCCHELTSCGVELLCGDCSIYETWDKMYDKITCIDTNCMDCMLKHECSKVFNL